MGTMHLVLFNILLTFTQNLFMSWTVQHGGKVGSSPKTPGTPGPPRLLPTSGTPWDPQNILGPRESPWDHRYFSECDAWKVFLGNNSKFFIFKKLQYFNYKNFSILNRLFLGNNLLENFKSSSKSTKYT